MIIEAGLLAGFTLGAAGSLHCIGMCGPISLALPVAHFSKSKRLLALFLYQAGRILTYSFLGLLLGLAGRSIYLSGYQRWFSIVAGSLILLSALLYFYRRNIVRLPFLNSFYQNIQKVISYFLKKANNPAGFLLIGMANGFLPCGMVYIAMASVLSFNTITESVGFMAMFGAGTFPAMMTVAYAGRLINPGIRASVSKAIPVFVAVMGMILILRGMNLGIPFISPELPGAPEEAVICH
ncbi:MAG TPA: sulfite exporter TauE/SafE family protein [Chitinophagaceae bacterium]|nr:sulfite exporter TauE/SafE family protein [Chitinophagaceae bacterium]